MGMVLATPTDIKGILIIDQESGRRKMIARLLEDQGFIALPTQHGTFSLHLLDLIKPDLALIIEPFQDTDLQELASKMRGVADGEPPPRILVITSQPEPCATYVYDGLADDCLTMPFPVYALVSKVRRLLGIADSSVTGQIDQTG